MTVQVNSSRAAQYRQELLSQKKQLPSNTARVYQTAQQAWSYTSKSLMINRNILNAGLRSCLWFSAGGKEAVKKVQTIVTRSKLFSIISIPFNAVSISLQAAKIRQSLEQRDYEGIYLGLLTFAILVVDTLDSLATAINAALETFASTSSQLISSLGLPLGFIIVSIGSLSRGVRLYHLNQFCRSLEKERFMKSGSSMTPQAILSSVSRFLKDLGLDDPQKLLSLERHTTSRAASLLKKLHVSLKQSASLDQKQAAQILQTLHQINRSLRKEIVVQTAYAATNLLIFASLCLFFASVASALPPILLAISWSARLILQAYQDFKQEPLPKNLGLIQKV